MDVGETTAEVPRLETVADWVAVIRGIIVRPLETLTGLAETRAWKKALGFYLAITVASSLVALTQPAQEEAATTTGRLFAEPLVIYGVVPLTGVVFLFLYIGVLYRLGLREGGTGSYSRLFTTETFQTSTLALINLPISLLVNLLQHAQDQANPWLNTLLSLPITLWGLVLTVVSLRASMGLSRQSAITVLLLAFVAGLVLFGLIACVAVGFALAT
jgi:hypothetical protein